MYRSLDPEKLIQTIRLLRDRIGERFPNSGLSKVAGELLCVSDEAIARAAWIGKPNLPLRAGVALLVAAIIAMLFGLFTTLRVDFSFKNFSELVQGLDAGCNVIVLIGASIFFLVSLEIRLKRKKALKMLHELRALAHIVDVHQLTKDPERLGYRDRNTTSSPIRSITPFELSRYLDYCSEMLSLIGKIAALYSQYFDDPIVLEAVDQVEDLTTGLSRKIWQKIMIIDQDNGKIHAEPVES